MLQVKFSEITLQGNKIAFQNFFGSLQMLKINGTELRQFFWDVMVKFTNESVTMSR